MTRGSSALDENVPPPLSRTPAEEARRIVLDAGFDRIGFARAGVTPYAGRFAAWVERGFAGSMAWLERTRSKREDPTRVLPGARTVIATALHYTGGDGTSSREDSGIISTYAQGDDYHRVLESRLSVACDRLRGSFTSHHFRYYADTGPVLERAWAEAAGIGWIGKNACAIDPERGSFFSSARF